MIHYLSREELPPDLAERMFRARAEQFSFRLGWPVTVDAKGWETDEYDARNPLYIIWTRDGAHAASLRVMPTTGPNMTADYFSHLSGGPISSPHIWECTRFCLGRGARPLDAARVLMAGLEYGLRSGIEQVIGVFDDRMRRVYKRLGHEPEIIGSDDGIHLGLWPITPAAYLGISRTLP
jgi:acyl homoserine lactone synthase